MTTPLNGQLLLDILYEINHDFKTNLHQHPALQAAIIGELDGDEIVFDCRTKGWTLNIGVYLAIGHSEDEIYRDGLGYMLPVAAGDILRFHMGNYLKTKHNLQGKLVAEMQRAYDTIGDIMDESQDAEAIQLKRLSILRERLAYYLSTSKS